MTTISSTTKARNSKRRAPSRSQGKASRRRIRPHADDLNRLSWLDFLETLITEDPEGREARRVNGRPLAESDCRALHRWRVEGAATSLWKADAFLIRYGGHVEEFMIHCLHEGLEIWASGREPDWFRDDLTWQDLESCDAQWRAEAQAERDSRRSEGAR